MILRIATKRKANFIQEAGLRLIKRRRPSKTFAELYVEVSPPAKGESPPRIYVGTRHDDGRGTATLERFELAIVEARAIRAAMVQAHIQNKPVWMR